MRERSTLQQNLLEVIVTVYRANPCMIELYCKMRRKLGEIRYISLLSVVLPYQDDLETATKVVIDDF